MIYLKIPNLKQLFKDLFENPQLQAIILIYLRTPNLKQLFYDLFEDPWLEAIKNPLAES